MSSRGWSAEGWWSGSVSVMRGSFGYITELGSQQRAFEVLVGGGSDRASFPGPRALGGNCSWRGAGLLSSSQRGASRSPAHEAHSRPRIKATRYLKGGSWVRIWLMAQRLDVCQMFRGCCRPMGGVMRACALLEGKLLLRCVWRLGGGPAGG